jgi:hypothetical protein
MAANPLESGILPRAAEWPWQYGPVIKTTKRHIFCQGTSYEPRGPHAISKALLDVGIDPYAGRDWLSVNKICKICYSFC